MTTALLADDEHTLLLELRSLLADAWPELQVVAEAATGSEARRLMDLHRPDVAFLDIRMPGIDGMAVAELAPAETQIVFVTAHPEHAVAAFEHAAADYLHKPVTPKRLALSVQRLQQRAHQKQQKIDAAKPELRFLQAWVGQNLKVVEIDLIAALKSEARYTRILTMEGDSLLLHTSLTDLLSGLDENVFWQIHRACVVNARAIERVLRSEDGEYSVHVRGHTQGLPVSRSHRTRFRGM